MIYLIHLSTQNIWQSCKRIYFKLQICQVLFIQYASCQAIFFLLLIYCYPIEKLLIFKTLKKYKLLKLFTLNLFSGLFVNNWWPLPGNSSKYKKNDCSFYIGLLHRLVVLPFWPTTFVLPCIKLIVWNVAINWNIAHLPKYR